MQIRLTDPETLETDGVWYRWYPHADGTARCLCARCAVGHFGRAGEWQALPAGLEELDLDGGEGDAMVSCERCSAPLVRG